MTQHLIKNVTCWLAALLMLIACQETDTYAERREAENKQIKAFLHTGCKLYSDLWEEHLQVPGNINVISESQFFAQDSTTDVAKNEYVLLAGVGIYMQIVHKGVGEKIKKGERATILNRYVEYNIAKDSILSSNRLSQLYTEPEVMTVLNTSGTYSANFLSGLMLALYGQATPSAWLAPLPYIRLGRQSASQEQIAKVRLIVPSTEGHQKAYQGVYPCFYEITYQRGR